MVTHRPSRATVDVVTFLTQPSRTLVLLGTDAVAPPRHLVDVARACDWFLFYPSTTLTTTFPARPQPGPATHRHRLRDLTMHDYAKVCLAEEAIARDIEFQATKHRKIMAIVPSHYIAMDSVPSRLRQSALCTTVSLVSSEYQGEFVMVMVPENDDGPCTTTIS